MKDSRVVITGFMGSGKTSVARALAQRLRSEAIDLDEEITNHEQSTPGELIARDGEAAFRVIETRVLQQVLKKGARVIALGGGAWTISGNRDLISKFDCVTVWLDVPFEICWKRISEARRHRPLALDWQQAKALYETRRPLYELATLKVEPKGEADAKELARYVEEELAR